LGKFVAEMSLLQILEVAGKGLTVVNAPRSGKTTSTSSNPSVEVVSSGAASESDPKDQTKDDALESEPRTNLKVVVSSYVSKGTMSSAVAKKGVDAAPLKAEGLEGSSTAPESKKRPVPSSSTIPPWKKPSLKNQLCSMVIKPSVKFSSDVQVSTIPMNVAPTPASKELNLKAPVSLKTNLGALMTSSTATKSVVICLPDTSVPLSTPICEGTLPPLSQLSFFIGVYGIF
jgi:hypothetical protein